MLKAIVIYGIAGFILLYFLLLLVISVCSISATASLGQTAQTPQLLGGVTKPFWTKAADMPTPRTEVSATSLGDVIYVIGGFDAYGHPTDIVEIYSVMNNTWKRTAAAPLPNPLHHTAATSFNGKVYVVGGFLDSQWTPSNRLFIYDPLKNQWHEGKPMPTPRGALTANFVNGTLYAVGGQSSSSSSSSLGILATNEAYDVVYDRWTTKASMPTARHHAASAVVNGKLYVIAGRVAGISPTVNVNANEMYDPEKNKWILLEPMPSKRSGIVAATAKKFTFDTISIYVFGGEEPSKTFNNNERYDIKTNKWTTEVPMPTSRHGLGAASVQNKIYVIGGGPQPGLSVTNANEIFHVTVS
jgi:N-acetylneuraminic acid mutarotase